MLQSEVRSHQSPVTGDKSELLKISEKFVEFRFNFQSVLNPYLTIYKHIFNLKIKIKYITLH